MEKKLYATRQETKALDNSDKLGEKYSTKEEIVNSGLPYDVKKELMAKLYKKENKKSKNKDIELDPDDD